MQEKISGLLGVWQKRNIDGIFCENKDQVHKKLSEIIPADASIGFSGSLTLEQLEVIEMLSSRGNQVFNQYDPGLSREESLAARRLGVQADYFLTSANAVSESGELVFFSAYGQRIAGIAGARKVVVVCGTNKITPSLAAAIDRARNIAVPLNCKRLHWGSACLEDGKCRNYECSFPEYNRMCCQVLVVEAEVASGRMSVILVGEDLGF